MVNQHLVNGSCAFLFHIRGLCERSMGEIASSLISFQQAFELDRTDYRVHVELVRSMFLSGNFDSALGQADASLIYFEEHPEFEVKQQLWMLHQLRGQALVRLNLPEEALDPLFRAYELNPNFKTKQLVADIQTFLESADALETYQDILQFSPQNIEVLLQLGRLQFENDNFDAAFDLFSKAVLVAQKQLMSVNSNQAILKKFQQQYDQFAAAFFGMGLVLQEQEPSAALQKYRVVGCLTRTPRSGAT